MYLRLKTIKGKRYAYVVESRRTGGRVVQRSLCCLGPLDGAGRSLPSGLLPQEFTPCAGTLRKGAPVEFTLLINGDWRLLRGMVVDPYERSAIVRYPLLGALLDVQKPWSQLSAWSPRSRLPLAGHGLDPLRLQTVLPI